MKRAIRLIAILAAALILAGACRKGPRGEKPMTEEEIAAEMAAEEEAKAAAAEAAKPAPPKITDEIYAEIKARTALIGQKYAEDPETGEKEIAALHEKLGITFAEVREFEGKLDPAKAAELRKKIQELMQKLLDEYR